MSTSATCVVDWVPVLTPAGSVFPKPSVTLSPSSSSLSSVAVTVKVFAVSPLLNVRLAGTPL